MRERECVCGGGGFVGLDSPQVFSSSHGRELRESTDRLRGAGGPAAVHASGKFRSNSDSRYVRAAHTDFISRDAVTVGLLRRARQALRHRAPSEGRDRGPDRGGPPVAARRRGCFLLLEQQ